LKPGPKNEAERLAFMLIEFFCPATINLSQEEGVQNKESNKFCESTIQILHGTALGDGITLTYYSSDSKEEDSVKGTATKL